jgi:hypothetical protein
MSGEFWAQTPALGCVVTSTFDGVYSQFTGGKACGRMRRIRKEGYITVMV